MKNLQVLVRGAGEMGSAAAARLIRSGFKVVLTDIETPLAVRRKVSFSEALHDGRARVEELEARSAASLDEVKDLWEQGLTPVVVDPGFDLAAELKPEVIVDAVLAKRNLGLKTGLAELVVALGPGFEAGRDADVVVETNRGHNLGRLIRKGQAEPDTGTPGEIAGRTSTRVLRSPGEGRFETDLEIGALVTESQAVARVDGKPVAAGVSGVLRGLIRPGTMVWNNLKVGDVDPRGRVDYCGTISDKARNVSGSVLEAIMIAFNK